MKSQFISFLFFSYFFFWGGEDWIVFLTISRPPHCSAPHAYARRCNHGFERNKYGLGPDAVVCCYDSVRESREICVQL